MGIKAILKRLFTSVPLLHTADVGSDAYPVKIPEPVVTLSSTIAAANGFAP
jgi:hypothetical protein